MANEPPKKAPNPNPDRPPKPGDKDPNGNMGNFFGRTWFWIVLAVVILFGSRFFFGNQVETTGLVGLDEVARMVNQDQVDEIVVQGETISVDPRTGTTVRSHKEGSESLVATLRAPGGAPGEARQTADPRGKRTELQRDP